MSASIRRYITQRENFQFSRGYTEAEKAANNLRINFLKRYIINFDTNLYKTQQERDWAYIARRQYRFDVQLESAGYATMIGIVFSQWRTFVQKKMVFWPLLVVLPISYFVISPILLEKHNKKLFDMCNLGEDFFLGIKRNEILSQCNKILEVEDF